MLATELREAFNTRDFRLYGPRNDLAIGLFTSKYHLFRGEYTAYLGILALSLDPTLSCVGFLRNGTLIMFEDDEIDTPTRQIDFLKFVDDFNGGSELYELVIETDEFFIITDANGREEVTLQMIYYYHIDYYDLLRAHDRADIWAPNVWRLFTDMRIESDLFDRPIRDLWKDFVVSEALPFLA